MVFTYTRVGGQLVLAPYSTVNPTTATIGTVTGSSVTLTNISGPPNFTYNVVRNGTVIATGQTGSTYTDNTVSGTTTYTYKIIPINNIATGNPVTIGTTTTPSGLFPSGLSTTGLLAYYPLNVDTNNYASGSAVTDATSTTSCSIVANSSHTGTTGSLYLNATGSTSYFATKSITLPANSGFTIAFWVKYANTNVDALASWNLNGTANRYMIYLNGGVTFFYQNSGSFSYPFGAAYVYNTWTHIVMAVAPSTGGTSYGYINGAQVTTISTGNITQPTTYSSAFTLGADNFSSNNGVQDYFSNLYIFNRQLSQAEVTALYGQ